MPSYLWSVVLGLFVAAGCRCDDPTVRRTGPVIEVDPAAPAGGGDRVLDFGGVRIGALEIRHITVKSAGTAVLKFTAEVDASTSEDLFVRAPAGEVGLFPGEEHKIEVRYVPSAAGEDTGKVTINSDDPEQPQIVVRIAGHGVTASIRVCRVLLIGGEQCHDEVAPDRLLVDMGEVSAGSSVARELKIYSTGDADLRVGRMEVLPGGSAEWSTDAPVEGFDVAAGASHSVQVTFSAFDGGEERAELEVLSDDPEEPRVVVDLRALGKGPRLCVEPSLSVDFGSVAVGQKSLKQVDLVSCGTEPIEVKTATIAQPSEFGFEVAPVLPQTLQAGDRLTLRLQYQPQNAGDDFGRVFITSSDPGTPRGFINLRGSGTLCDLDAAPDPVDFGSVPVGVTVSRQVLLRNRGNSDCSVSALGNPTDAAFALVNPPQAPFTLVAGGQKPVTVSFAPSQNGQRNATFRVSSNDGDVPERDVVLRGTGTQPPPCALEATPSAVVFPDTAVGQQKQLTLVITNRGTDDCFIGQTGMKSGSSNAFTATASGGGGFGLATLGPGGTYNITVTFAPQTAGAHQGDVEIKWDEQNPLFPSNTMYVPVSGTAPEPRICVSPTEITFTGVPPNTTAEQTLRITSCGAGDLKVRRIGMAPGTSRDFSLVSPPALPLTLASGASVTVRVGYRPTASSPDFGAVEVGSNDPTQPMVLVQLRGNAVEPPCAREVACAPDALEFPETEVGRTAALSITCISTGAQPVTVTAAQRRAGTSQEFTPVPQTIARTLAPGQSLRVEVLYTPNAAGGDAGAIEILSDGCVNKAVVGLTAVGKTPNFPPCPPPQTFSPVEKWGWAGGSIPSSIHVGMTPVVVNLTDDNIDGLVDENDSPDVVFTSCTNAECCINCTNLTSEDAFANADYSGKGHLRAIRGKDGVEIWTVTDPALRVTAAAQLAAGDLDGDNLPEIIAVKHTFRSGQDCGLPIASGPVCGKYSVGTLFAFDRQGKVVWESDPYAQPKLVGENGSAPMLADMDQDGFPEVIHGQTVFDRAGTKKWETTEHCGHNGHGCFPVAADLDDDGDLEVIFGKQIYNWDGTLRANASALDSDAFAIVVDVDSDGQRPEIIYRNLLEEIIVASADGSLRRRIALPDYAKDENGNPDACGAPIAAADLDGDGGADFIVPAGNSVHGIKADGTVLWSRPANDYGGQCGASGAAAFDFEGDGKYEGVYHDPSHVWVFRGTDGQIIYDAQRNSVTLFETPVIADIDNDNHADILFTNMGSPLFGFGVSKGLVALSNAGNTWPATRRVWMQHAYHITDSNENGTIPRRETPHWKTWNSVRANPPLCRE